MPQLLPQRMQKPGLIIRCLSPPVVSRTPIYFPTNSPDLQDSIQEQTVKGYGHLNSPVKTILVDRPATGVPATSHTSPNLRRCNRTKRSLIYASPQLISMCYYTQSQSRRFISLTEVIRQTENSLNSVVGPRFQGHPSRVSGTQAPGSYLVLGPA